MKGEEEKYDTQERTIPLEAAYLDPDNAGVITSKSLFEVAGCKRVVKEGDSRVEISKHRFDKEKSQIWYGTLKDNVQVLGFPRP